MADQLIKKLLQVPELKDIPASQLEWLVEKSECHTFNEGDFLFKKGDPIVNLYIILQGHFTLKIQQNNQFRTIGTVDEKMVTGALPYSRASSAIGIAEAAEPSQVLALSRDFFKEMICEHHELTTAFVHIMSTRIRNFTKLQQQNDKMMALGKLSAGLAHELNNPSAAVIRSAQALRKHLKLLPEDFKKLMHMQLSVRQVELVTTMLFEKLEKGVVHIPLMEKTSLEDEIADWLEENGTEDGYEAAENFADYGFTTADLDKLAENTESENLPAVTGWLNQIMTTEKLVNEIEDASGRIHQLVTSVKSYTHMDQAPERQESDIHKGLDNTLAMLNHKIKKANVEIVRNYQKDLPHPCVFVSEMNQVWTNLIDNAIDALENAESKKLEIQTRQDGEFVQINIIDSGDGIPEEIQDQIFDPFFTTKPVGKGTGLGLDIVQQIISQHNGSLKVNSTQGRTEFRVCIPIK